MPPYSFSTIEKSWAKLIRARFSEKNEFPGSMSMVGVSPSKKALRIGRWPNSSGPQRWERISFGDHRPEGAREAVLAGRVRVNGRVLRDPECWVRPERDVVQFDGRRLRRERRIYLAFYKPKGVIVSHGDPGGRKTIYDCLGSESRWVVAVGRLDKDTSGLLLLTNDTEFAHFIESPESGVPKTYLVRVSGLMDEATIARLRAGVRMKRGDEARPLAVRRLEDRGKYTRLEVVLTEGKNREVRRMVEAVGFKVLKLVRTAIGPLTLEGLEVGRSRPLTAAEVAALRKAVAPPQ
jgi:pseudouridine synthase